MKSKLIPAALVVATAAALPAGASAADVDTAVKAASGHTAKADRALDRAATLFRSGRDAEATRAFAVSRRQMTAAEAAATRAHRRAKTRADRDRATRATQIVGAQQDENVEALVGLVEEAEGRVEERIAAAALADIRGRDKAIAVLARVSERGVSARSAAGIARALQSLSQNRDEEVGAVADALAGEDVSDEVKSILSEAVERNVEGQAVAGATLAALIASDRIPAAAKAGLQRAYDAIAGEQERSAQSLGDACGRMPEAICTRVTGVVAEAGQNAQEMRDGHPSGPPSGAPAAQPSGTPTAQPSASPVGAPAAGRPGTPAR